MQGLSVRADLRWLAVILTARRRRSAAVIVERASRDSAPAFGRHPSLRGALCRSAPTSWPRRCRPHRACDRRWSALGNNAPRIFRDGRYPPQTALFAALQSLFNAAQGNQAGAPGANISGLGGVGAQGESGAGAVGGLPVAGFAPDGSVPGKPAWSCEARERVDWAHPDGAWRMRRVPFLHRTVQTRDPISPTRARSSSATHRNFLEIKRGLFSVRQRLSLSRGTGIAKSASRVSRTCFCATAGRIFRNGRQE